MKKIESLTGRWNSICLLCSALLVFAGCGSPEGPFEAGPYAALGKIMAAKTAELCDNNANIVVMVGSADSNNLKSAAGRSLDVFIKALPKNIKVTTETLDIPLDLISGVEPVSAQKFRELIGKHASADVLVSFVGVPFLSPAEISQLPADRPKVVEVIVYNPPARSMFAAKLLYLAALPLAVSNEENKSWTPQQWFDARYQLITPENMSSLPF